MPVGIRRLIGMKIRSESLCMQPLVRSASEPMRKGQENLAEVDKSHRPERWSRSGSY
jgi:hypothetical protein